MEMKSACVFDYFSFTPVWSARCDERFLMRAGLLFEEKPSKSGAERQILLRFDRDLVYKHSAENKRTAPGPNSRSIIWAVSEKPRKSRGR